MVMDLDPAETGTIFPSEILLVSSRVHVDAGSGCPDTTIIGFGCTVLPRQQSRTHGFFPVRCPKHYDLLHVFKCITRLAHGCLLGS